MVIGGIQRRNIAPPISTLYGESSHSLYMLAMGTARVTDWATCRLKKGSMMYATQFITIGVTALSAMPSIYGPGNNYDIGNSPSVVCLVQLLATLRLCFFSSIAQNLPTQLIDISNITI